MYLFIYGGDALPNISHPRYESIPGTGHKLLEFKVEAQ